jgi:hypothetical protein
MEDNAFRAEPLRSGVDPKGYFIYGVHKPHFCAANLRQDDHVVPLGWTEEGRVQMNQANFPPGDVQASSADTIFEIPNPFPFRGVTYICASWADQKAANPAAISIPRPIPVSLHQSVARTFADCTSKVDLDHVIKNLPAALQLALATGTTDPRDLISLARSCCRLQFDPASGRPKGIMHVPDETDRLRPWITNHDLFEVVVNNPHLPDDYKEAMVLRPGVQGTSEIVGEFRSGQSHVYEYLRRNSYIPWGHYAANMAHDAVRYAVGDLTMDDVTGMRHLYYQRTYVRLAESLGIGPLRRRRPLSVEELDKMRQAIKDKIVSDRQAPHLSFNATLWGWNYGFGYASSGYRLHASHQQIHQQFALIASQVPYQGPNGLHQLHSSYACGDLISDFSKAYRRRYGLDFFTCYQRAIETNQRLDGRSDRSAELVVYRDDHVLVFVPKAQTSQWELQLMTLTDVGNILEADAAVRRSLDAALLAVMVILTGLGATMISVIEYSKRFDSGATGQRLLYAFLPKIPESPGAFSEAQLRWINGHYPEDFALVCRQRLKEINSRG